MITIERAKVEDIDRITQVLSETWIATYADHLSRSTIEHVTTHWHDPELLQRQIEEAGDFFAVAKDHETIIGLITVTAKTPDELQQSCARRSCP